MFDDNGCKTWYYNNLLRNNDFLATMMSNTLFRFDQVQQHFVVFGFLIIFNLIKCVLSDRSNIHCRDITLFGLVPIQANISKTSFSLVYADGSDGDPINIKLVFDQNSSLPKFISFNNCTKVLESDVSSENETEDFGKYIYIYQTGTNDCTTQFDGVPITCKNFGEKCECEESKTRNIDLQIEEPPKTDINVPALVIGVSIPVLLLVTVTVFSIIYTQKRQSGKYNPRKQELDGALEAMDYLKPPKMEHYV
ncbi:hypothetical protein RF11_09482 [Thelohanellus kitauei]|uniref:Uncharacterized protein n=1 Tax=Thelohanellus kitauei TaxID=669202 RepID=A0A0C2NE71_THEKT|nr:hypothetical protein RF11_09482 [Thelohanellus kitauei]